MPSRPLTLAILAFWLATTGWYLWREVAGRFQPDNPPPYVIEFADEALKNVLPTRWAFTWNGRAVGTLRTSLKYREADDSFELLEAGSHLRLLQINQLEFLVEDLRNRIRVTRDGELRGMETDITFAAAGFIVHVVVAAEVRGGMIERSCRIESPLGKVEPELEPVPFTRGSVLTPLHPVNRITGLRPGQRWRAPLVDPFSDAMRAALEAAVKKLLGRDMPLAAPEAKAAALDAQVLAAPQILVWENAEHECLVIEYRGDEYTARTWVRMLDGLVLRQEARSHGEELILQRE